MRSSIEMRHSSRASLDASPFSTGRSITRPLVSALTSTVRLFSVRPRIITCAVCVRGADDARADMRRRAILVLGCLAGVLLGEGLGGRIRVGAAELSGQQPEASERRQSRSPCMYVVRKD